MRGLSNNLWSLINSRLLIGGLDITDPTVITIIKKYLEKLNPDFENRWIEPIALSKEGTKVN